MAGVAVDHDLPRASRALGAGQDPSVRPEDDCQRLIEIATRSRAADDVTVMVADYQLLY